MLDFHCTSARDPCNRRGAQAAQVYSPFTANRFRNCLDLISVDRSSNMKDDGNHGDRMSGCIDTAQRVHSPSTRLEVEELNM